MRGSWISSLPEGNDGAFVARNTAFDENQVLVGKNFYNGEILGRSTDASHVTRHLLFLKTRPGH